MELPDTKGDFLSVNPELNRFSQKGNLDQLLNLSLNWRSLVLPLRARTGLLAEIRRFENE
jgi:hypothetical protein